LEKVHKRIIIIVEIFDIHSADVKEKRCLYESSKTGKCGGYASGQYLHRRGSD